MRASELRIGNLLQSDTNKIIKIVGVVKKDIYYYHNKKNLYVLELNNFKPIPLTEEWLIKLGLHQWTWGYYHKNGFVISVERQVYFGEEEVWIAELNYVHQLQNLYFALTGEELNYKPL